MKTLYVSDLDGTLLNSKEKLSDFTLKTINSLISKGIVFSYATARSIITASKVTAGLNSKFPVITYNGAFVINSATREIMLSNYFLETEIECIKKILTEHKIFPIVHAYIDKKLKFSFYNGHINSGKKHFLDNRKNDIRRFERDTPNEVYAGEVFYFQCIGEKSELAPINEIFMKDSRFYCVYQKDIYSGEQWCEILPANATKANAILRLKEILSCDRVISFGDGKNDIPMFEVSDECYAVGNANIELKEKATAVIDTNENDGVAKWFKKNLL